MRFLSPKPLPGKPKILLIQTANSDLIRHVIKDLIRRYPEGNITLLRQRNMETYLKPQAKIRVIDNVDKGQLQLAAKLRNEKFDLICFVESGEPGFWKLKLLPFYCNPIRIVAYNRIAEPEKLFPLPLFSISHSSRHFSLARIAFAPMIFSYCLMVYFLSGKNKIN